MAAATEHNQPTVTLQRPAVIVLLGVLLVAALITTSPIAFWLLYALAIVVALSYVWTRHTSRSVSLRRRLRNKWATVGDQIEEEFELVNRSRLPILVVEIDDHSELPGYTASIAEGLGSRQTKHWRSRGTAERRGLFRLGPADLTLSDPFGIFSSVRRARGATEIVVYPPISAMADVQIPAGAMVGTSRSSIRTEQVTSDAGGIRDFRPGDPLKRIHWLSSARREHLLVKEFDLEPTANLWIALDLDAAVQAGSGNESTEEYGVKIVSSLAYQLVRDNKSVGFIALGRDERYLIEPRLGLKQLWRILESLALIRARARTSFADAIRASLPVLGRGASLVAITPSADVEWLRALSQAGQRSIYPLAIALDASTFGKAPSNRGLEAEAAAAGVGFMSLSQGMAFATIQPDGQTRADFERTRIRPPFMNQA